MVRKKTDPFWVYVEERPNERWKCKFCGSEYSGRASRIKAHFGQVKNRGIEVCHAVHPWVKAQALSALHLEVTEKGQTSLRKSLVEETTQNIDKRIEAENIENFHHLSDIHLSRDGYQSVYNDHMSGEDPPIVMPLPLPAEFPEGETDLATLHKQFRSDFLLPDLDISNVQQAFPQEDIAGCTAGEASIENYLLQDPHQSVEGNAKRTLYRETRQRPSGKSTAEVQNPVTKKAIHLGTYQTAEDAALAYDHAAYKLKGLKPRLNFPHLYVNHQASSKEVSMSMPSTPIHEEDVTNSPSHVPEGLVMNMPQQSGSEGINEKLHSLKRKLEELDSQKEEREEELYCWRKKVKAIKNGYKSINGDHREGELSSFWQVSQVEELIAEAEELKNPGAKTLSKSMHNTKGAPMLTTELIGRESEISKILNYIIKNDILRVGVYGMGGVGKTGVMMHIYNKLLENEAFDNIFWATIPQDFTIYELQDIIGNAVHLDELSHEKNEKVRASILYRFLTTEKKTVLILDGLWQHFDFYNVGIPMRFNGFKLVIVSRSLDVCRMMLCQAEIKIQCLSAWMDQWSIFLDKLGQRMVPSTKVRAIAGQIISTYEGLPLYINTIATRMRGVENVHEWKDMLEKMKDPNARFKELKNEVIYPLKLSYEFLADEQLQQCFIYCAFYIGSRKCRLQREMIEFLIDVGLVSGVDSRQKSYDKANTILDKLENACLLERVNSTESGGKAVMKMHDAIIDMAVHYASNMMLCMDNFGTGLKKILSKQYSIEGLDEISCVIDGREEISNRSTCYSRLSILTLHGESCLRMIPGSLFSLLPKLRILDLSETKIEEIPDFVGDLVNLTALVLRGCSALRHVPCIQKLKLLRKLDLYRCKSMRNIPDGLESLRNLEFLDLYETSINDLPGRVVSNFTKLQYLKVNYIEAEELVGLHKLETLYCCFPTTKELTRYLLSLTDKGPAEYLIFVGRNEFSFHQNIEMQLNSYSKAVVLNEPISMKIENYRDSILLPKNVEILLIVSWASKLMMLSDAVPLENLEALEIHDSNFEVVFGDKHQGFQFPNSYSSPFPNLKRVKMTSCPELKYIVAFNSDTRFSLPVLQEINIEPCANFEGINATSSPVQKHISDFHCREAISISDCNSMRFLLPESLSFLQNLKRIEIFNSNIRILFTTEMFLHLQNLEEIDVQNCPHLEKIIMPASQDMPLPALAATCSSKLTSLYIRECNMIKRLLNHELLIHLCHLQIIDVSNCRRMEEITNTYNENNSTMPAITSLPNLKTLRLMCLTQLRSIGTMKIDSAIEIIEVIHCPKIKRIPLYLPLHQNKLHAPDSLKKISVSQQDWWDSLEWESQEVKTLLQPYVEVQQVWEGY